MSPKDERINLRVTADWITTVDDACRSESDRLGVKVSRNAFIERAALQAARRELDRTGKS